MLSLGVDLEGEVNNSFGFLSDMDSGTLPRKRPVVVQVQSWNERAPPRRLNNIRQWDAGVTPQNNARATPAKPYSEQKKVQASEVVYAKPVKSNSSPRYDNQNMQRYPPHAHESMKGSPHILNTNQRYESHNKSRYPSQGAESQPVMKNSNSRYDNQTHPNLQRFPSQPSLVQESMKESQRVVNTNPRYESQSKSRYPSQGVESHPVMKTSNSRYDNQTHQNLQRFPSQPSLSHEFLGKSQPVMKHSGSRYGNQSMQRYPSQPPFEEEPRTVPRWYKQTNGSGPEHSFSGKDRRALMEAEKYMDRMDAILLSEKETQNRYISGFSNVEPHRRKDVNSNRGVYTRWEEAQLARAESGINRNYQRQEDYRRETERYRGAKDVGPKLQNIQINEPRPNPGIRGSGEWDLQVPNGRHQMYGPLDRTSGTSNQAQQGSYLLQRTDRYLDAIQALHNKNIVVDETAERTPKNIGNRGNERRSIPVEPPRVPDDAKYHVIRKKDPPNRMTIVDPGTSAPPPAPPMPPVPPPMPPQEAVTPPLAPWLHDVKSGRKNLKRIPSLQRTELEPVKEPLTFRDKLKHILEGQLAAQRWPAANTKKRGIPDVAEVPVEKSQAPYNTIKTLSKSAMKNKLEEILKDQASFHGESDMSVQRKAAVTKLRALEKEELRRQWERQDAIEDEFEDDFDERVSSNFEGNRSYTGAHLDPEPVAARQRMLMGDVVTTINLRGAKDRGASYT